MTYFLDLFSGIGGFALGAYWAGLRFDRHFYSEVDPYAIRVYSQRFPDAESLGDIRNIRGADIPEGEWIIAGGFPCQDISVAGKGAGLAGERSGLWYEYARIIGELRPRFAIMENVGALTFRGLDSVLGSLAALGYDAEWQDIRASDVGAPHRRERLWIVAYPEGAGWETRSGDGVRNSRSESSFTSCSDSAPGDVSDAPPVGRGAGRPFGDSEREAEQAYGILADSPGAGCETKRITRTLKSENANFGITGNRRGLWATEPDVGRVAHGIPARVDRLKCLGNSIVPEIAELIFAQSTFDEWRESPC